MRWSFRIATLFGIRIELHVTFLLLVGWIALRQWQVEGSIERALTAALLLVLVFACVLLHELGHALAAARYGIRTREIVLLPIGGLARLQRMPENPRHEIVVALAGPAVNVVLAALLLAVMVALRVPLEPLAIGAEMLATLVAVNVAMLLFNLIPAFPMDGGRVLRAALALRLPFRRATRIAATVGQTFALLFGAIGLFGGNFILMFIALFVFLAAGEERAMVETRASLGGLPVRAAMVTEFDVLDADDPLDRAVERLIAGSQQDFPVVERGEPVGVLTRADLAAALREGDRSRRVGSVVTRDGGFPEANDPLEDVIQRMRERRRTAVPVTLHGRLVGLLTLENVGDLLLVRDAMDARRART